MKLRHGRELEQGFASEPVGETWNVAAVACDEPNPLALVLMVRSTTEAAAPATSKTASAVTETASTVTTLGRRLAIVESRA